MNHHTELDDSRGRVRWEGKGGNEHLSQHPCPEIQIVVIIFNNMLKSILVFYSRELEFRILELCLTEYS